MRESNARDDRQRGSGRGQMQKISAGKFHYEPPFTSFDHLVGGRQQRFGDGEAERLSGPAIDEQLEFDRLLDRQVGGLCAFENPPDIIHNDVT